MNEETNFSEHLKKLLEKIKKNKIYGSLEIYFENGKVTQITQRIINKIHHKPAKPQEEEVYSVNLEQ